MIRLPDTTLVEQAAAGLMELQAVVDAAGSYADRVAEGKRLFELRNKPGVAVPVVQRPVVCATSAAIRAPLIQSAA
jgi:hypothetical protein